MIDRQIYLLPGKRTRVTVCWLASGKLVVRSEMEEAMWQRDKHSQRTSNSRRCRELELGAGWLCCCSRRPHERAFRVFKSIAAAVMARLVADQSASCWSGAPLSANRLLGVAFCCGACTGHALLRLLRAGSIGADALEEAKCNGRRGTIIGDRDRPLPRGGSGPRSPLAGSLPTRRQQLVCAIQTQGGSKLRVVARWS